MFKLLEDIGCCSVGLEMEVLPHTQVQGAVDWNHVAVPLWGGGGGGGGWWCVNEKLASYIACV